MAHDPPVSGFREIGHIAYAKPDVFSTRSSRRSGRRPYDRKTRASANASTTVTMLDSKSPDVKGVVAVLDRSGVRSVVWS